MFVGRHVYFYVFMSVSIYVWIDVDGFGVGPPSTNATPLRDNEPIAMTICVFVNTIQKEVEMDIEKNMK